MELQTQSSVDFPSEMDRLLKSRQLTDREKNELNPDPDLCLKSELVPDLDRDQKWDRVKDQIPIPIFFEPQIILNLTVSQNQTRA